MKVEPRHQNVDIKVEATPQPGQLRYVLRRFSDGDKHWANSILQQWTFDFDKHEWGWHDIPQVEEE